MRVAMIGPFGFRPNKTMRARAFRLGRALVDRGHDVALFMPPWQTPDEADRRWVEDGVAIRYVALDGGVPRITRRLVGEALDWRPDVVHCFKPKAYSGLAAWWLWQRHRRRLRLVVDSDDWEGAGGWNDRAPYTPAQKRFFAWQERWGLGHCHTLTVASRTLESLAWAHGVAHDRVVYLPNGPGIDITEMSPAARQAQRRGLGLGARPTLLLYSRLFEFNTARLVDVLARVRAAVPDVALLAVGAGLYAAEADQFRTQLADVGLTELVVDVGWVEEDALPALLAAADAGVYLLDDTLLNRTKCPVKLADMLAAGVPVVAEAVGQAPEYVRPGETGVLRPVGDVAGLASEIVRLLQDEAARSILGVGARAWIDGRYRWARLAVDAERAYGWSAAEQETEEQSGRDGQGVDDQADDDGRQEDAAEGEPRENAREQPGREEVLPPDV